MAVAAKPPGLFTSIRVGTSSLQHRVALAPCTRFRADIDHAPTDLTIEYYSQRTSTEGTLLITGATVAPFSAKAGGYDHVPGIYTDTQNPDLPRTLKEVLPLTQFYHTTFYTNLGPKGYVNYSFTDHTP